MNISRPKMHGFTLVELMVVVVVLGGLAAAGIYQFSDSKRNYYNERAKAALREINMQNAVNYQKNRQYYPGATTVDVDEINTNLALSISEGDVIDVECTGTAQQTSYTCSAAINLAGEGNNSWIINQGPLGPNNPFYNDDQGIPVAQCVGAPGGHCEGGSEPGTMCDQDIDCAP